MGTNADRERLIPNCNQLLRSLRPIRGVNDSFDGGVHDLSRVHIDADFVADRVLPWGWVEIFRLYQNLERGL